MNRYTIKAAPKEVREVLAQALEEAWWDGYGSYDTPASPYTCSEDAWNYSETKMICDELRKED